MVIVIEPSRRSVFIKPGFGPEKLDANAQFSLALV